ncbi:hypothetical protein CF8_3268 [Nocardioides sp. CF8]|uniref:DUF6318 family protein n=1 Tax=Nocardioides sp. CF8 TaxID=110319 RepID=UPI00032E0E31|nr:DUF6318 family protein [Nocardioides sp. CF8]EON22678.1 hypothetical protein CF8_3268 [Nocardioides sp. CF8]
MLVRRLLAATVVVPLLLVAGCSDEEPEPVMPTTSSPTTSPSSTPTVDPLAIPAEAKEPTKAGAEALVRHYFDMFNHLWATGDSAPVRKLYGERCDLCEIPIGVIELAQSNGHTYAGSQSVSDLTVELIGQTGGVETAVAFVSVSQTKIVERDARGKVVNRYPADARHPFEYNLAFQGGQWEILSGEDAK